MLKKHLTVPIYDKNTQQSRSRGSICQHNKGHIWEIYSQYHIWWVKTKNFSTKIRNKTRVSAFTTSIQHGIVSSSHSDQTIKGIQIGKVEIKLSLFANDLIVYTDIPIHSTKKTIQFNKWIWQNGGIQSQIFRNQRHFVYSQWKIINRN